MGSSSTDADHRARLRRQEVVADLSQQALETGDLDTVLEDAAAAVAATLDVEYCAVFERPVDGTDAVLRQGAGWPPDRLGSTTVAADRDSQIGTAIRAVDPVVVDDFDGESRATLPDPLGDRDAVSAAAARIGPVDEPWGVLSAYAIDQCVYTDDDVDFLERVAALLESAIETERARRELERTERRFEAIFEDPNVLLGLLEPDGTVVDINGTAMEYIDADLDDVTGEPFWETPWWDEDDVRDAVRQWTERAAAGEYVTFQAALTRPDGQQYALEGVFRPVTDEAGEVTSVIVSDRDVTEQVERENRLERYETIVEVVNDGVYVVDGQGQFTMANETYAEMLGYEPADLVGEHVSRVVDDDVIDRVRELEATATEDTDWSTVEAQLRTADGDLVPVEATFAILPDDDSAWHRVGITRDISERKARERELEESERRYRTLVENFPDGAVGLYDEDLEYLVVGGEAFDDLGVSEEEVTGVTLDERYPDDLVAEIEPHFRAVFDGESNTFEYQVRGRDVWAHTVPVRNEDDEIVAGMVMVQDVTERREYERKLEESNERLERFAYAASHDLQEPLRMVTSYLTLLESRYGDAFDEDGREFLAFAVDGAERMREMIDGHLEYSRVETEGDPFEPTDLGDLVDDVLADLQFRIEETDAEITVGELPRVEGDSSQLRQVFQNLLSNAITYSGDGPPRVHVDAERRDQEWVLSVADEGIGIDPADQERVFTIFNRLHSREEYEGTGIGLALSERIVERHGGEIWVDADPGEGATFSFTLPASHTQ
ncbi:PAS domain S-box protein [Natrinema longum]|uniref:histidine kinase n=1 Tax=Natrinema longum TaxID=370324 RepID=A0A8A2UDI8_9EURY|nr:PAS domain S-box protein [Natrinema longum]MBZ6495221.1 PAS domain S-box protein [Natrinema longum]QSW86799.1 PAS domain S-box protein [Natrinema longum]